MSVENVQRLEVHYYLVDGAHSMNAFVRNKCESEALAAFSYIAIQLGFDVVLETTALTEGGLKETWAFIMKPESSPVLIAALSSMLAVLVSIWNAPPKPDKDLEQAQKELMQLSIQEKKLINEKLSIELLKERTQTLAPPRAASASSVVDRKPEAAVPVAPTELSLQTDPKVTTRRSNFYKQLIPYEKVTGIAFGVQPRDPLAAIVEQYVPRSSFRNFILHTDKLPSRVVDSAVIEIVAPVIKEGDINWKGVWAGESISFAMNDKAFKEMVMRREVSFQHGNCIACVLQIQSKLDEKGDEKITGYAVTTVLSKIDGETANETPKGRAKRFYDAHKKDQDEMFPKEAEDGS